MNKKLVRNVLVLTLAAVVLVTATVFTTMAYLLSSAKVSNVFTVGNVAISMFETKVDKYGNALNNDGIKDADSNSYELLPGHTYKKDPTIYIQGGSQSALVFAKIKNQITNLEVDPNEVGAKDTMREQMEAKGWRRVGETDDHHWIYVYTGAPTPIGDQSTDVNQIVKPVASSTDMQTIDLFHEFTLRTDCDKHPDYAQASSYEVTITAYAIQDTKFGANNSEFLTPLDIAEAWNIIVKNNQNETHRLDGDMVTEFLNGTVFTQD